jgi:sensor histidine kinase YesM
MKWKEIIVNALFWLITAWLITSSFSVERLEIENLNGVETVRKTIGIGLVLQINLLIAISLVSFYFNLFNVHQLVKPHKRSRVIFVSIIILLVSIGAFLFAQQLCFAENYALLPLSLTIGVSLFYFTISTTYGLVKVWIQSDRAHQHLKLVNKQAELTLLRNQLRPHFLFNALNNLLSMVDQQKSPQLSSSFEKLSNLLRYVIEETKSEKVCVSAEIEFVKNYCDLQLLRFEKEEVDLKLLLVGEHGDLQVEPGLFIPFIENAFKYGTEPELKSVIEIKFDISEREKIAFSVKNKKANVFGKNESTGTGISSTIERLNLVYPSKHTLQIQENDYFLVELNITLS